MKELGEQWIEEIDGKKHMLKAVAQLSIYDGKSINGRTCHGCSFVDEWDDDCTLKNPPCRISEHKAGPFIIKDHRESSMRMGVCLHLGEVIPKL